MIEVYNKFRKDSSLKAADTEHRRKISYNIGRYDLAVRAGKQQYANLELARTRAAYLKNKVIGDLEKFLVEFEVNFEKNGGKIIWAQDAGDAIKEILEIIKKYEAGYVVKSKSMVTEEIELNKHLGDAGVEAIETDLGEFIVQQAGEQPYHIVTPAMHKSKEDVAALFNEKFGLPPGSTPEQITTFVRSRLREKFFHARVGITGANFLVADTGSVCLTENEGNGLMSTAFPDVHIVIAGIEKVIPSVKNLDLFWPLLATHGTGQKMTAYNSLISGPRQEGESDGPTEMIVILLDNSRSEVLSRKNQRRALGCIRCGACLNACPVYKTIGGHAYGTTYSGPIGSVITPWMKGLNEYKHLSFASSLCGSCTEVCPVKINLHELLLYNRNDSVKQGSYSLFDAFSMFAWKKIMLNRKWMDTGSAKLKNMVFKKAFSGLWGPGRELPEIAAGNFKQLWEERREGKIRK
ncbi:Lactate utilization protein B [bioreactor metagenome]|jgi:L-lactate dehydrogenase complex protein LldF|uniref:Lactate utilization protein B n=1 Tax=bioreactor metagenome TaxID=1076179 RepID=A0A644U8H2_9ZZZZ|nr:LutB/LldF family L-lactate oxidation iron-sulfur protein [Lentimicrobium sp.]MEA5109956.1 LutB/LldF family L-lactate oxidation iron-sulfur protein [Lentimicrobium sp.]